MLGSLLIILLRSFAGLQSSGWLAPPRALRQVVATVTAWQGEATLLQRGNVAGQRGLARVGCVC